jgi:tyrosyl-tRNA synthetase
MFSLEPIARIDALLAGHDADRSKRLAQRELARAMTSWVHGADSIAQIESASGEIFGGDISKLGDAELEAMSGTIPSIEIPRSELEAGIALIDLLVRAGLEDSKSAARRQITQGGASVNNVVITDVTKKVAIADLLTPTRLVLRKGRKQYRIVRAI